MTKPSRILTPLFLAFALLFAQQGALAHALGHAIEQSRQQDSGAPHSGICEQCATYAQLGNALHASTFGLPHVAMAGHAPAQPACVFRSADPITAAARGPPAFP